jgi:hypothetical protein
MQPLTQQPIIHIDATPDADYVLRILTAYRQHADCNFEVHGVSDAEKIIYDAMNEANVARAELLDAAIKKIGG